MPLPWMRHAYTIGKIHTPFHLRLREEREARGLSLTNVARKAGMSPHGLHYLETGVTRPTIDHVMRVAVALGVTDWRTLIVLDEPEGETE